MSQSQSIPFGLCLIRTKQLVPLQNTCSVYECNRTPSFMRKHHLWVHRWVNSHREFTISLWNPLSNKYSKKKKKFQVSLTLKRWQNLPAKNIKDILSKNHHPVRKDLARIRINYFFFNGAQLVWTIKAITLKTPKSPLLIRKKQRTSTAHTFVKEKTRDKTYYTAKPQKTLPTHSGQRKWRERTGRLAPLDWLLSPEELTTSTFPVNDKKRSTK